jgi:hypothetical protein
MSDRTELQSFLELILGSRNVYYQPPETIKIQYPCIIYTRNSGNIKFADDILYFRRKSYKVTVVSKDPDNEILTRMENAPMCSFDRHYTADNLNHDVFNLYY